MKTIRYWACKRGAVGCSWCIPQPWLAPTGERGYRRNRSKYQFASDRFFFLNVADFKGVQAG
jgi:hypothetical protein